MAESPPIPAPAAPRARTGAPTHAPHGRPLALQLLAAAEALGQVMAGRGLDRALDYVADAERPGVQALAYEALRRWGAARWMLGRLAERRPAPALGHLLTTALALSQPGSGAPLFAPHTVVDQAVEAARRLGGAAAARFANAVLRRAQREADHWAAELAADVTARTNLPPWWWSRLVADWGLPTAEAIAAAGRQRPPMVLRVNRRRSSVDAVIRQLAAEGVEAIALGAEAVHLPKPAPVQRLAGFAEGWWSVQDLAAQAAAPLLLDATGERPAVPAGARVLDACAAPGGKTAHLLERQDLTLTAIDRDPQRVTRIQDTLRRLGLTARVACADAGTPADWWDGQPFDAILLDAPCTASGVVRRHPDIPWLRREADVGALAREQDRLLAALWPLLAPGGRLLFVTCSVFRDEGSRRIDSFLQRCPGARPLPGAPPPGHRLPVRDNDPGAPPAGDGFFYALVEKN
jgi:16S rRNA (cytosine967-C5)-methyltransferase